MKSTCLAKLLFLLQILHGNLIYTANINKHTGNLHTFNGSPRIKSQNGHNGTRFLQNRGGRDCAMIPSFMKKTQEKGNEDEKDEGLEIVKDQIYNELKQSEDVLKSVFSRILDHILYYAKHKVVNSFLQFYIVNPLGMGAGNLLNSDVNDSYITSKLKIPTDATPGDFYLDYSEVEVPSTFGHKIPKKCWFIESDNKNSKSAFILLHGWFGNLQSCLPFLNVLKKCGVLKTHHVLIVDLKDHVGKSFESNTGLKGVTDLYDSVAFLHNAHGVTKFDVYAQSISALSALMFFDCYLKVKDGSICDEPHPCGFISGIDVDLLKKVNFGDFILESPVSNISEYLSNSFSESLNWVIQQFIQTVNSRSSHHIDSLSLNTFLSNHKIRGNVHILQGMHDRVTSPKMLQNELAALKSNVNLYVFKDGGHTDLSATSPGEYLETVNYIINYKGLWKLFKFLKNKKNNLEL